MFVGRYKTGIAVLSITRYYERRGAPRGARNFRESRARSSTPLLYSEYCLHRAEPARATPATPLARFHYTVICQRKKALGHTIHNIAAKMQTSLAHPRRGRPAFSSTVCILRQGAILKRRPQNFQNIGPPSPLSSAFHPTYQYCSSAKLENFPNPPPPPSGHLLRIAPNGMCHLPDINEEGEEQTPHQNSC